MCDITDDVAKLLNEGKLDDELKFFICTFAELKASNRRNKEVALLHQIAVVLAERLAIDGFDAYEYSYKRTPTLP